MLIAIKIDERVVKVSRLNHVIVTQSYFRVKITYFHLQKCTMMLI